MASDELYHFLPVPESLGGSLFMMIVYGFILLQGANQLSEGSEALLEVFSPSIIGGLVLPILGALPDCLIIVFSGLGDPSDAATQVKVGLGTLAGSTVMLLTLAWSTSLLLGRCDLVGGTAKDKQLTRQCDYWNTGVTTDKATSRNAIIMLITTLLYFIVEVPAIFGVTKDPNDYPTHGLPALVGFICCFVVLIVYIVYQIIYPELRRHVIRRQRERFMRFKTIRKFTELAATYGGLLGPDGELSRSSTDRIFDLFDLDKNNNIDKAELRALLIGLDFAVQEPKNAIDEDVDYWMREFDKDLQGLISKEEFHYGLMRWVQEKKYALDKEYERRKKNIQSPEQALAVQLYPETEAQEPLVEHEEDDDYDEEESSRCQLLSCAFTRLVIGTFIAAFFADPMVDVVTNFADKSKIPTFIVAFVVTPLASNASELVSSFRFAIKKKKKNISLTFSQIYGAVTMNNTLCLGLFLVIVYFQKLTWDYSAEVAAIVIPTIIVGIVTAVKTTFRSYEGFVISVLYIVGIVIVYVLENVLGVDCKTSRSCLHPSPSLSPASAPSL